MKNKDEKINSNKKILMVVSNVSKINDEIPTGVWMEEFASPYLSFKNMNWDVVVASINGGVSPIDEKSILCENPTEWDISKNILDNTEKLSEIDYKNFDAIFFPGGHAPMFDIANDEFVGEVVSYFFQQHKIVAAVCHGPCALINAKTQYGDSIVSGKNVTSFTDKEEKITFMDKLMPFLLEDKLKKLGANFIEKPAFSENVVVDKNLITGQNQNSSQLIADVFIERLVKQ